MRSCQGGQGTTSSPAVSFLANPVHYTKKSGNREEKQGDVARVDSVLQPSVQWFYFLQTLYITLLCKKSGTRGRSSEKLPGWTGYNLQSSGFVPRKPCTLHYYVRSLGTGRRSMQRLPGWTVYNLQSSGFVPRKPCTLHYYVRSLGTGRRSRDCQGGQGTTSSPVVSFLANPINFIIT